MTTPKHPIPQTSSPYGLEWAVKQAIANACIEGFQPDADFYARLNRWLAGEISHEEYIELAAQAAFKYAAQVRAAGYKG